MAGKESKPPRLLHELPTGKAPALHRAGHWQLVFVSDGMLTLGQQTLQPGAMLLAPPSVAIDWQNGPNAEWFCLLLPQEGVRRLSDYAPDLSEELVLLDKQTPTLLPSSMQLRSRLSSLLTQLEEEQAEEQSSDALCWALSVCILILALRRHRETRLRAVRNHQARPDAIAQVRSCIDAHYTENLKVETLAEQFGISKYHLSHAFQRQMGVSVYHYIIGKRLAEARRRIETGEKPTEVCRQCGFGDYANFYRAFRGAYGYAPRDCGKE